ncbi:MAG: hypothetical protein HY738_09265 [Bacteroidia bacterium]|nr:hypothetical protein [Bacteroidia bacterium]
MINNTENIEAIRLKITEIEEITESFNKTGHICQLDIDLALSKVRDLYDELLFLKRQNYLSFEKIYDSESDKESISEKICESKTEVITESAPVDEAVKPKIVDKKEKTIETASFELVHDKTQPEQKKSDDKEPVCDEITTDLSEKDKPEERKEKKRTKPELKQPNLFETKELSGIKTAETEGKKIIADKFKDKGESLNDLISKFKNETDLATRLKYKPISNLHSSISLNDKIMFIKELFEGNTDKYNNTLNDINKSAGLDDSMQYIHNNFNWDDKNETVIKFIELIYRRFLKSK